MRAAPPAAAPRAGTPADAQVLIAAVRADARRRRWNKRLGALIVVAAVAGCFAAMVALSGSNPAPPGHLSPPAPLTARAGEVTGYIDPCEGLPIQGLPYAAGTVTALRGQQTWKPDGPGTSRLQLPATVAARQHVGANQAFSFDLAPGQYVLVARYQTGNAMSFLAVSVAAGQVLHRDLPNLCR
jgi:hypothetical protein